MIVKRKLQQKLGDVLVLILVWVITAAIFFLVVPSNVFIVGFFLVFLFLSLSRSVNLIISMKSISSLVTLFIFAIFLLKKLDQLTIFNGIVLLLLFGTLFYLCKPRRVDRRKVLG